MRNGGPPPRMSSQGPHAGFPQGFLTRRNLISSRFWLTNAIDRIVKESKAVRPRPWRSGRREKRLSGPSVNWPSLDHRDSMLAAGVRCRCDILPGRCSGIRFLGEAKAILTVSRLRSTGRAIFFKTRFVRLSGVVRLTSERDSTLSAGGRCLVSLSPRPFPSSFSSARQEPYYRGILPGQHSAPVSFLNSPRNPHEDPRAFGINLTEIQVSVRRPLAGVEGPDGR